MRSVAVLMSSYNGAVYIADQIESILMQECVEVSLTVRDDGSSDATTAVIMDKQRDHPELDLIVGRNLGPCSSFLELLYSYNPTKENEYVAFSDQDDIWDCDKLITAVLKLEALHGPALYYSALRKTDISNDTSKVVCNDHQFSFEESLVKSAFPGCTMVLNAAAVELIKGVRKPKDAIMHDWFIYQVLSGSESKIYYDETPHIQYRIHRDNYSVKRPGFFGELQHAISVLKKQKGKRYYAVRELQSYQAQFATKASVETLRLYASYREALTSRLKVIASLRKTRLSFTDKLKYSISIMIGFF